MFDDLESKKQTTISDIEKALSSVSLDNIRAEGFTIMCGTKVLKLSVTEEKSDSSIEDVIRKELSDKLSERLLKIGDVVKKKLDDMTVYVSQIKSEYEKKTYEVEERLKYSNIMPNITYEHARQGLSLSKGNDKDELKWFYQAVYWPKYIDNSVIDKSYSKRMVSNIVIMVTTFDNKITRVDVKKPIGMGSFEHYHTGCWGNWNYSKEWTTPDDIIKVCKEAEIVLETINTESLANRSPRGLPRVSTVLTHSLERTPAERDVFEASARMRNSGISADNTREDAWSV